MPLHKRVFYRGLKHELFAAKQQQEGNENDELEPVEEVDDQELFKKKLADLESIWNCPRHVSNASIGRAPEGSAGLQVLHKRGRFNNAAAINLGPDTFADPELAVASMETGRLATVKGADEDQPLSIFEAHERLHTSGSDLPLALPFASMFRLGFTVKRFPGVFRVEGNAGLQYEDLYRGTVWGPPGTSRPPTLQHRERQTFLRKRAIQEEAAAATASATSGATEEQKKLADGKVEGQGGERASKRAKVGDTGRKGAGRERSESWASGKTTVGAAVAPRVPLAQELEEAVARGEGMRAPGEARGRGEAQGEGGPTGSGDGLEGRGRNWWPPRSDALQPLALKRVPEEELAGERRAHQRLRGLRPLAPLRSRVDLSSLPGVDLRALCHGEQPPSDPLRDLRIVSSALPAPPDLRYESYKPGVAPGIKPGSVNTPDFRVCLWGNSHFPDLPSLLAAHTVNQEGKLGVQPPQPKPKKDERNAAGEREKKAEISAADESRVLQPVALRHVQVTTGVSWFAIEPANLPFTKS